MNKIVKLLMALVFCILLVGCGSKSGSKDNAGKWSTQTKYEVSVMSKDALDAFEKANTKYELVALLGKQVVAGMNYMYLAFDGTNYRVVVVYNDLDGKATVSHDTVFDATKFANVNKSNPAEELVGGWKVEIPDVGVKLEDNIQKTFDRSMEKLVGMNYTPIGTLSSMSDNGTTYLVLCYGSMVTAEENSGVYLLTLHDDGKENYELKTSAYIDLANYNK